MKLALSVTEYDTNMSNTRLTLELIHVLEPYSQAT